MFGYSFDSTKHYYPAVVVVVVVTTLLLHLLTLVLRMCPQRLIINLATLPFSCGNSKVDTCDIATLSVRLSSPSVASHCGSLWFQLSKQKKGRQNKKGAHRDDTSLSDNTGGRGFLQWTSLYNCPPTEGTRCSSVDPSSFTSTSPFSEMTPLRGNSNRGSNLVLRSREDSRTRSCARRTRTETGRPATHPRTVINHSRWKREHPRTDTPTFRTKDPFVYHQKLLTYLPFPVWFKNFKNKPMHLMGLRRRRQPH